MTICRRPLSRLSGRLITPVSDSKDELLVQYVTAMHGSSPIDLSRADTEATLSLAALALSNSPPAPEPGVDDGKVKGPKRSALTQDTPVKATSKRPKAAVRPKLALTCGVR